MIKTISDLLRSMNSNSIKETPDSISPRDVFNNMINLTDTLNAVMASYNINELTGVPVFRDKYEARALIPRDIMKYGIVVTYCIINTQDQSKVWVIEQFIGEGIGEYINLDESWRLIDTNDVDSIPLRELDEILSLD